jgi:metal-responsive CopG/Arc/MetJ family transcriptional regulator
MATVLTVRLDDDLERELDSLREKSGLSRSEFVREVLRRQLRHDEFAVLRKELMPYAEAQGWLTDEDVFREVS